MFLCYILNLIYYNNDLIHIEKFTAITDEYSQIALSKTNAKIIGAYSGSYLLVLQVSETNYSTFRCFGELQYGKLEKVAINTTISGYYFYKK